MITRYVGKCRGKYMTPLKDPAGKTLTTLLWGDPVRIEEQQTRPDYMHARGFSGVIDQNDLDNEGLLEFYVIDVGQGDGVLFRTPDDKWHLMDAGVSNSLQMTKKGAANFLRWKFQEDLGQQTVSLADVFLSHPDSDHYGGLIDVFNGKLYDGRTFPIEVENFYHTGLAKFAASPRLGATTHGTVQPLPHPEFGLSTQDSFITELLDNKASFQNPPRALSGSFSEFATLVGQVPKHVRRLSYKDQFLPGYAPGQKALTIRIMGPILETFGGQVGLRYLDTDSKTVNGHSLVLLLEYDKARILLTGDLNALAQQLLLSYSGAGQFAVDVAKACHHGSEDIKVEFLKALKPRVTLISSGDNEDYSHPRPVMIGASGKYGRESRGVKGDTVPPLVYSTELARSVKLDYAKSLQVRLDKATPAVFREIKPNDVKMNADDWRYPRWLRYVPVSTDLVYGLVNVRTDGQEILCGTMLESGDGFDIKVVRAGIEVLCQRLQGR